MAIPRALVTLKNINVDAAAAQRLREREATEACADNQYFNSCHKRPFHKIMVRDAPAAVSMALALTPEGVTRTTNRVMTFARRSKMRIPPKVNADSSSS
jgi:hypothetical protein